MKRWVVGLAVLGLGCAKPQAPLQLVPQVEPVAQPSAEVAPAEPTGPSPRVLQQYAVLEESRSQYLEGLERISSGELLVGRRKQQAASRALFASAAECAQLEGCDVSRFLDTMAMVFQIQRDTMDDQASLIATLREREQTDTLDREPGTSPFVSSMPQLGQSVSLLRGTDLREIITLNGPVQAALDDWLTWMRPLLMSSYHNYQYLRDSTAPIYEQAGLPEALLFAMMATESGGRVHAFSRAGAAGPLQFMRHTGRKYGLHEIDDFDLRLDPASATRANVAYLNDRFEELNDSLEKALAAYNGGENRALSLHRRLRGVSLWDSRWYYSLPTETRDYVPRILAAAWLFLHPEEYNLEFPELDTRTATLTPSVDVSIGELTICLGQRGAEDGWFRTLRNLNPRLEPGDRVPAGGELRVPASLIEHYTERCQPQDPVLARARQLHDANYPEGPSTFRYTVSRGDTLGRIAARHRCVTLRQLAELNGIRAPSYVIHVGQRLRIPSCG